MIELGYDLSMRRQHTLREIEEAFITLCMRGSYLRTSKDIGDIHSPDPILHSEIFGIQLINQLHELSVFVGWRSACS